MATAKESTIADSGQMALTPSDLGAVLSAHAELGINSYIEGPPGIGKTSIVGQVARDLGLAFIHLHAPTKMLEDFGIPWADEADSERFKFRFSAQLPLVGTSGPDRGIFLIDELASASQEIQKLCANLMQARELHGVAVKPGWSFVGTGNRAADRAGAGKILSDLRDRMTTLALKVSHEEWLDWASAHGVHMHVLGFIQFVPSRLFDFDAQRDHNATPRGWAERASPVLDKLGGDRLLASLQGAVGPSAAIDFLDFRQHYGYLPSREDFLAAPAVHYARLPVDKKTGQPSPGLLYAIQSMLTYDCSTAEVFNLAMTAAGCLPNEFGALTLAKFMRTNRQLPVLVDMVPWLTKYKLAMGQLAQK